MATELAKAYVQIIPSAKGIKSMLQKELGGEAASAGESAGKSFGDGLLSGLAGIGKAAAAALGAATAAVGALSKMSLSAYGNYEQLMGGVETLYKDSADIVTSYANSAYKTAGMSANQYMEIATSFSASLLQGLQGDTEAAARYTDMAISDMSDNINKFGSDAQSVQNAYQGFAKGNFTMLDNLKIGYGGTQSEMQRLLDTANKLNAQQGINTNYQIKNYADIVAAIHVVQTEMGISGITAEEAAAAVASGAMTQEEAFAAMGTTAKEAATTIQGSLSAAKSAWQNLVVGIADGNADLDTLIGNFVNSVGTAADNIVPRFTQILSGMGQAVQKLAPIISEQLPIVISTVLPSMVSAGSQLLVAVISGIITALPELAAAVPQIVEQIGASLTENWPSIQTAGGDLVNMLVSGISGNLPTMISAAFGAVLEFVSGLTSPENLSSLIDGAIAILNGFSSGITESIGILFEKGPEIIENLVSAVIENAPKMWDAAIAIIDEFGTALSEQIPGLSSVFENLETVVVALTAAFVAFKAATAISSIIEKLTNVTNLNAIAQAALNAVMNANPFVLVVTLIAAVVAALVTLYKTNENFRNKVNAVWASVKSIVSGVVNAIVTFFTSTVPNGIQNLLNAFIRMKNSIVSTVGNIKNSIVNGISTAIDWIKALPGQAVSWGSDMIQGFANGILNAMNSLLDTVRSLADKVRGFLHFSRPDTGPLRDYETWMPDFMQGLAKGIDSNAWRVEDAVSGLADMMRVDMDAAFSPQLSVSRVATAAESRQSAGEEHIAINININGAQYSDEQSLAKAIADKVSQVIQFEADRKRAAYGTA